MTASGQSGQQHEPVDSWEPVRCCRPCQAISSLPVSPAEQFGEYGEGLKPFRAGLEP